MSADDPLTGLPVEFVRMLAVEIDPWSDNPNKPLDDFFATLMRAQTFRHRRKAAETDLGSNPAQEGRLA
jgi:hypothetical protein